MRLFSRKNFFCVSVLVFLLFHNFQLKECDAHPISSMVVTDIYIKTKSPNPLEQVGWGIFIISY